MYGPMIGPVAFDLSLKDGLLRQRRGKGATLKGRNTRKRVWRQQRVWLGPSKAFRSAAVTAWGQAGSRSQQAREALGSHRGCCSASVLDLGRFLGRYLSNSSSSN